MLFLCHSLICTRWLPARAHTLSLAHLSIHLSISVTKTLGYGTSHQYTNIHNFYSIQYSIDFTKQYCRSSLHIENSSTQYKECVFKYFRKATLNFVFSFLTLCGQMGKHCPYN